jgi:hypothetical protein
LSVRPLVAPAFDGSRIRLPIDLEDEGAGGA